MCAASPEYRPGSVESRFLDGTVDFETAVDELTDGTLTREHLAQILHGLRSLDTDPPAGPTLSEHDAKLLDEADFGADPGAVLAARLDRDLQMRKLVRESLSVGEAAERLGVSTGRIRQRIGDGTLWAFRSGRHHLLPAAQFTPDGTVPHLETITPLLPKDLHPLTVQALLLLPRPELVVDGHPTSIARYLAGSAGTDDDLDAVRDLLLAALTESA